MSEDLIFELVKEKRLFVVHRRVTFEFIAAFKSKADAQKFVKGQKKVALMEPQD